MPAIPMDWPSWRTHFVAIMDPRFYTEEWLDGEVEAGRFTLMTADDAAILVAVEQYPAGAKEVHGIAAAGNMETIVCDLIPQAEEWGRGEGCIVASIESREGWARALRPAGYEVYQVKIRKEL